jgi:hypothetical protein
VEEGAGVMFRMYGEGADHAQDAPIAEMSATHESGKAAAEWEPVDIREAEDTSELKYFFIAASQRAKPVKSGLITVKNPRVVEMRWEKKAALWGKEVSLHIKSREIAETSPKAVIEIYNAKDNDRICLLKKESVIDGDEKDINFTLDFDINNLRWSKIFEYSVCAEIKIDTLHINYSFRDELLVQADF